MDSIKKNNISIARSEQLNDPCKFKLRIESEIMKTENAYDLPPNPYGNFEYLNRTSLYNEANNVLLMKTDDIYKDLTGLISNSISELFQRIFKILLKQTDIFIFNTQNEVSSPANNEKLIINFNGVDKGIISIKEESDINILINNMLVNQQKNFRFNYQPNYKKSPANYIIDNTSNNVISFNVRVEKKDKSYVFELVFKSLKELKLSQSGLGESVHSTPVRLSFNVSDEKISSRCYTELIFDINKSLYKFLLFNLESKN
eukprot:TRINITY_DN11997_c0_g1_i1.p1 TRINITY_DN11997_c0_g1~~TRINITY_DN11997_c0_g1_i1.p1  ORF type:complete len:287 (-),score=22.95 TRINITY_DN11997_c0_g1_i1:862-1638(-)